MPADLTPIEALDRNILTLSTRINAATYELLVMIREFDERAGFVQWGLGTCAEWLAWRCDIGLTAAREKVRVAHALKHLPHIAAAFAAGELSYSKVRELTRVANRDNEEALLAFALRHTAVTVAERCRELRCGRETSIDVAGRAYANRSLRIRRDRERSVVAVTVELPLDTGELLEKALDKARDDDLQAPDLVDTAWSARQADAFVNLLNGYLAGDAGGSNENYLVTIHVDESALAGGETCLDNLMLLCTRHHALVHEGDFRIQKDFLDNWAFFRPDGIGVPEAAYVSAREIGSKTHAPAGAFLTASENCVRDRPPPIYWH